MATAPEVKTNSFTAFFQSAFGRNVALGAGMALVISMIAGIWFYNQKPDYRVLLSNYSDRDGGSIIAALQTMNVPYRFAEGGGAILVPAERVHDARLKLAAQGLPKGGNMGFELMENQKLGTSQFLEQVNFQRAMEGELARTINSIGVVQAARVHLAIPKPSAFVRDKQTPTASVMLNLHTGRTLDRQQVSAIVHLVSSSVPELNANNVTVVDQNGNLLSSPSTSKNSMSMDPSQAKYVNDLQEGIVRRIESILTPLLGDGNVRAEATAEVDFSRTEQAAETYKPNANPEEAAIRSQQSNENRSADAAGQGGVPGAASNKPTAASPAPAASAPGNQTATLQKESTTNYEVDKTVRIVQKPMGGLQRLAVAVVVNNKREVAADGKVTSRPLTEDEKKEITSLVKEAMGFNAERGDSLNVLNSAFAETPREVLPEPPFWKQFMTLDYAKTGIQYALSAALIAYLFFGVLRPLLKRVGTTPVAAAASANAPPDAQQQAQEPPKSNGYQENLQTAKQMATQDPKVVANVVKSWVNGNE
jgi:flagellar M-ring protein FliF